MKKKIILDIEQKYIEAYGDDLNNLINDLIQQDYYEKQDIINFCYEMATEDFNEFMEMPPRKDQHKRII